MILGAITNSWGEQILTTDLPRLVERARRRGAAHIELRQTYMGQYEDGADESWRPVMDKLTRLVRTFPILSFNLAIAYPFLTQEPAADSPLVQSCLEAAKVVGTFTPRLRVVDSAKFNAPWERAEEVQSVAIGVAKLASESARQEVQLIMENSGQPIRSMALVVGEARKKLSPDQANYLGLCVDPINSMRADPGSDPISEIEALPLDYILMVHFKQTRGGQPHPTVDGGDLDYPRLLRVLKDKAYDDLAILEIPAGEQAFDNFQESVSYLQRLMESR